MDLDWDEHIMEHVEANPLEALLDFEDPEFANLELLRVHNFTLYFECDKRLISEAYYWL